MERGSARGISLGALLLSLLAGACSTEEEKEYDIPARQQIVGASLEIEPGGSPLVFAQVGMNYATSAPLSPWESRYQMRNVQSIAYSPGTGGWDAHPFRNMQPQYGKTSVLLRNAEGEVQPLVRDWGRFILYAHKGEEWEAKKTVKDPRGGDGYGYFYWSQGRAATVGDSAWETPDQEITGSATGYRLGIRRNDDSFFALDSAIDFGDVLMLPGKGHNYLILSNRPRNYDPQPAMEIVCYRWNLGAADPAPRKQSFRLDFPYAFGQLSSWRVLGETRIYYGVTPDSLAEFALGGDSLAFLGYRVFPAPDSAETRPGQPTARGNLSVDPRGCVHSIRLGSVKQAGSDTAAKFIEALVHASSCDAAIDTLALPQPSLGHSQLQTSPVRFDADGNPMLSLVLAGYDPEHDPGSPVTIPPSWLYLARRGADGKWGWEKIAEY